MTTHESETRAWRDFCAEMLKQALTFAEKNHWQAQYCRADFEIMNREWDRRLVNGRGW